MLTLNEVLRPKNLREAWSEIKNNIRDDLLRDPLLHLDFQYGLDRHLKRLAQEVKDGRYRVSPAWFIRSGKGRGLFRIHAFLDVKDLVLIQAITRRIMGPILKKAPTKTAFFSRSQRPPNPAGALPHGYPWLAQWKAFQRHILRFSETYPFLVTTDISGYYDHIQHGFLRDVVSDSANASREVADLLFFILEELTHRPHYIPNIFTGLPVLAYDAPRLLAHAFLFELDRILASDPTIEFTRWMDDYDVGVKSYQDGKRVISLITQTLRKYYLMPNSAKTRILQAKELDSVFHFRENTWLSRWENRVKIAGQTGRNVNSIRVQLRRRYKNWMKTKPGGNWAQILKRYYTLMGYIKDPGLSGRSRRDLREHPEVTDHVLRYYKALGFRDKTLCIVEDYLDSAHNIYQDVEIKLLEFLAEWAVPNKPGLRKKLAARAFLRLTVPQGSPATDAARAVCVMLIAKYGTQSDQEKVQKEFLAGHELNPLVKECIVAFSPCLNPVSKKFEQLLNFAAGESAEPMARLVYLYRSLANAKTWPPEIRIAMTCSASQVPKRKTFSIHRIPVIYVAASNKRLRSETRRMVKRLIKENQDPVIDAHLKRVLDFTKTGP